MATDNEPTPTGEPVPLERALEDVAESLRLSASTMAEVMPSRPKMRVIRWIFYLMLILLIIGAASTLLTLLLTSQIRHTQHQSSKTLQIVENATSKKTAAQNQQNGTALADLIIICEDIHSDRFQQKYVLHVPMEPLPATCPADHL